MVKLAKNHIANLAHRNIEQQANRNRPKAKNSIFVLNIFSDILSKFSGFRLSHPRNQMLRIYTVWSLATSFNPHFVRNWTIRKFPNNSLSSNNVFSDSKVIASSLPQPTTLSFLDFGPESLFSFFIHSLNYHALLMVSI